MSLPGAGAKAPRMDAWYTSWRWGRCLIWA